MVSLARKDVGAVEVLTTQLRRLDDAVHPPSEEPDDYRRTSLAPVGPASPHHAPPALVVDDDDEDLPEVADEVEATPLMHRIPRTPRTLRMRRHVGCGGCRPRAGRGRHPR